MKTDTLRLVLFTILCATWPGTAQLVNDISEDFRDSSWDAKWITCPGIDGSEYGVYYFRKNITLASVPAGFVVHVSGDNRYKLYVNGQYINQGPATGDLMKWRYESLDLSPYLRPGNNTVAAIVWNFAEYRPVFQASHATGFILQGDGPAEAVLNTDATWKVYRDRGYRPHPFDTRNYYVVGPGEHFDASGHPWGWRLPEFDDTEWANAATGDNGQTLMGLQHFGHPPERILYPRHLPLMEETKQRFGSIRKGSSDIPAGFLSGKEKLEVPANTTMTLLLDQGYLTNAYPVLGFSGGKGSRIELTYAESLVDQNGSKGNRNEIEGKSIIGNQDIVVPGGGNHHAYQTLWWRTFRYLEIKIETKGEALSIDDFYSIFTGYPFQEKASFDSDLPMTSEIWDVGWRTQRLCAGETFFDCPYYEQLQYAGDTRIQCLVSTYVTGDSTMFRNALLALKDSRLPLGLTQSRYPSREVQIIPPFSLIWISMLWDYWQLFDDPELLKEALPPALEVLSWFEGHLEEDGLLGPVEYWNFMDWVAEKQWVAGAPPGVSVSQSSIINLHFVYTLQKAIPLLRAFGYSDKARYYESLADKIRTGIYGRAYDLQKGLLADLPDKSSFSQHANILGVLTNAIPPAEQAGAMAKVMTDTTLAQSSYYYKFYLFEALAKAGLGNKFIGQLQPWEDMLANGLTTFAEKADPTRSDCHAWSASPLYYFLSLVCGIKPAAPGFSKIIINPHPGPLRHIEGSMPVREGVIRVALDMNSTGQLQGEVILPQGLSGEYVFEGKNMLLQAGINTIR
jgi:hypothetical protein